MRILHLCSYPLFSGPLPATLGLALAQRAAGHQVFLACDTKRGAFNGFEEAAMPRLQPHALEPPHRLILSTKSTPLEWLQDRRRLRRLVRDARIDVVHCHLSHDHALAYASLYGLPITLIRTCHAARAFSPRLGRRWLGRRASGWIARCPSHESAIRARFGLHTAATTTIPGSIDSDHFRPGDETERRLARQRWQLGQNPVLLFAAHMDGRGHADLLHAVSELGNKAPTVLLAGDGPESATLKLLAQRLGLADRVRQPGYLDDIALRSAYAAADAAFILRPGNDAAARSVLEALASGLPIIGPQRDALEAMITETTGYPIAPPVHLDAICAALRSWCEDDARSAKKQACRAFAKRRTFSAEATATLAFYERRQPSNADLRIRCNDGLAKASQPY